MAFLRVRAGTSVGRRTTVSVPIEDLEGEALLQARATRRLGETLREKYRLDRVLGIGGMATVYAATHRNGKEVALKLLHPEFAGHSEVRKRFLREGYVANQVKHPGAVAVLDDDLVEGGGAFLVMELLSGLTVQELWEARDHHVHPAWAIAITLQVLSVLTAAHSHGIIHRDLKPPNLFVTRSGEVKVLDFGIARMRSMGAQTTNLHAVLGTPAFMAPEQAMGRAAEIDETTDLWALAAVAFALLSGDVVHPAGNTQETLIFAATRPARRLGPLAPDAPQPIVSVIERALSFDRALRWPSATAMHDALDAAALLAYGELPGLAVLRDALSVAKTPTHVGAYPETVDLVPVVLEEAPDASLGHRGTLRGKDLTPPVMTVAGVTPIVSAVGIDPGDHTRTTMPLRVRARFVVTAAVLGLSGLTVAHFYSHDRAVSHGASQEAAPSSVASSPSVLLAYDPPESEEATEPTHAPRASDEPPVSSKPPSASAQSRTVTTSSVVAKAAGMAAASPSASRSFCVPPFVIDRATKRKTWKLECL